MKRHIPRDSTRLTLCGIYAPHREVSDPEIGADPFDLCKTCRRIHRAELSRQEELAQLLKRTEETLKRTDESLAKPCCDGACGAP